MTDDENDGQNAPLWTQSETFPGRLLLQFYPRTAPPADSPAPAVYFHCAQPPPVRRLFKSAGFSVSDSDSRFNVCFGQPFGLKFYKSLRAGQLVSQFPGCKAVAQKALFCRCIAAAAARRPEFRDLAPKTWILPESADSLENNADSSGFFIYKPSGGSGGRGIRVVPGNELGTLETAPPAVLEEYITDVMIINGRKFDLRLYVLLTSVCPLVFYLYRDGLVRFAATQYQPVTQENCEDATMHLTNFAINFKVGGSEIKWSLAQFLSYVDSNPQVVAGGWEGHSGQKLSEMILDGIKQCIVRTMIAIEPRYVDYSEKAGILHTYPRRCFALYGFDILLLKSGTPMVLEVNKCPNKEAKTEVDERVKIPLLQDTMHLVSYSVAKEREEKAIIVPERVDRDLVEVRHPQSQVEEKPAKFSHDLCDDLQSTITSVEQLTLLEKRAILQVVDEQTRLGGFERLFPNGDKALLPLFEKPRYLNVLLDWWLHNDACFASDLLQEGIPCEY